MCAIMGILECEGFTERSIIEKMQKVLYHRGPDDSGIETFSLADGDCYLSHCSVAFDRLSIRDLSMQGHQPMFSNDKEVMIAFNGEIYNSEELRPMLLDKNISFRGESDTEVILNLYQQFGIDKTLSLLDGMFAICIADFKNKKMFLCRDRIGEKPLYIYKDQKRFMFASEYKAFYAHPEFKPVLDETAVDEYFLFRYVSGEQTFLKGVSNLTQGSYLEFSGDKITKHVYWTLPEVKKNGKSFEENKEMVRSLIEKSVSRRLISDRPIGLQLSGGVDSSYLCSVVKNKFGQSLNTYSITFANEEFSEEKYIDKVNSQLGLQARKFQFKTEDFIKYWSESTWFFEAPMNHEGTLSLCLLNREASREVTVMLCGDGPDELMGGYIRLFDMDKFEKRMSKLWTKPYWYIIKKRAKAIGCTQCNDLEDVCISKTQWTEFQIYDKLLPDAKRRARGVYDKRRAIMHSLAGKGMRKYMNYEMMTYMQDLLMRTDKISMASSIEIRVPFLMPELMEKVCEIPDDQLIDSTKGLMYGTKKILKSLCSDVFGPDFTYRFKMGLSFPFIDYFSDPVMRKYVEEEIVPRVKKRGIVNFDYFISLWKQVPGWKASGQYNMSDLNAIWCVISFELWAKMYLDQNPADNLMNKMA